MSKKIMIDPGHAPGNANGGKNGYKEYAGMWKLSNYLKAALERSGCIVGLTRAENEDTGLQARGASAAGYDLFISEHSNAANGAARGVEVYHSVKIPSDKAFAAAISKAVSQLMGNPDRGAKTREIAAGVDYYAVIDSAYRKDVPHILLVESGFHDNAEDEAFLLNDKNLKRIAEAQARVICAFLQCPFTEESSQVAQESPGIQIMSAPTATIEQMEKWAEFKNATPTFISLASIFYKAALSVGINPVAVYCQSAKETGYGRFGGVLDETYCNPCGMKNTQGGGDYDASAHKRFDNWFEGISAQVDHLALYAGAAGYPKPGTVDPRHFPYLRGTAKTVEELGGKWAPSAEYGKDIVAMMRVLEAVEVQQIETPISEPPAPDATTITLVIGCDMKDVPAENIGGFWYVTIGSVKVKIRDILDAFGYGTAWDESNQYILATEQ